MLQLVPPAWPTRRSRCALAPPIHRSSAAGCRPLAQGGARGVRVPPAQRVRQPAVELRRMGGAARNVIYVSATPGEYELRRSQRTVEMVVRPTGLVDPTVEVRPTEGQIDDLLAEVKRRAELGHRSLVTTLTKRFAEDLADYLREYGVKVRYLHSELDAWSASRSCATSAPARWTWSWASTCCAKASTCPRCVHRHPRRGQRGISPRLPVVHPDHRPRGPQRGGPRVMYADKITDSMRAALDETDRRRTRQTVYNAERGITPEIVKKAIYALEINQKDLQADAIELMVGAGVPREDLLAIVRDLEKEMRRLSKELQFEDAARVRDRIILLRKRLSGEETSAGRTTKRSRWRSPRRPSKGRWFGTGGDRAAALDGPERAKSRRAPDRRARRLDADHRRAHHRVGAWPRRAGARGGARAPARRRRRAGRRDHADRRRRDGHVAGDAAGRGSVEHDDRAEDQLPAPGPSRVACARSDGSSRSSSRSCSARPTSWTSTAGSWRARRRRTWPVPEGQGRE